MGHEGADAYSVDGFVDSVVCTACYHLGSKIMVHTEIPDMRIHD